MEGDPSRAGKLGLHAIRLCAIRSVGGVELQQLGVRALPLRRLHPRHHRPPRGHRRPNR